MIGVDKPTRYQWPPTGPGSVDVEAIHDAVKIRALFMLGRQTVTCAFKLPLCPLCAHTDPQKRGGGASYWKQRDGPASTGADTDPERPRQGRVRMPALDRLARHVGGDVPVPVPGLTGCAPSETSANLVRHFSAGVAPNLIFRPWLSRFLAICLSQATNVMVL